MSSAELLLPASTNIWFLKVGGAWGEGASYPDVQEEALRQNPHALLLDVIQGPVGPPQRVVADGRVRLRPALHEASADTAVVQ